MASSLVGQTLQDRYRIVRALGEGGMGAVYEAENLAIGKRVAIKVLHPEYAGNAHITARFHQEARAATSIGHENIIEVLDMSTLPDGSSYMVMEFLEGRDWADELAKGVQSVGQVARILVQVCDALAAAHDKGIVHRDLKPENIFLVRKHGRDDFVKVLDFGISKILERGEEERSLTGTGMMLGTAHYMSPEQTKTAKHVDHRSDLYTLGVILFKALTGHYPYDDEILPMILVKIVTEPAPPLSEFRADVSDALEAVYQRLMAKDPTQRFQSAAEVRDALQEFVERDDAPSMIPDATAPRDRRSAISLVSEANTLWAKGEDATGPLKASNAAGNEEPRAATAPARPSLTREPRAAHPELTDPDPDRPGQERLDTEPTEVERVSPASSSKAILIAGAGVAFAIVGAILFVMANRPAPHDPPPVSTAPGPTSTMGAEVVHITAFTSPDGIDATLYLDGEPREGATLQLRVPRTGEVHRIEARAAGYVSASRRVAYTEDQSVELVLEPEPRDVAEGPSDTPARATMRTHSPTHGAMTAMTSMTAMTPAAMSEAPATEAAPAMVEPPAMTEEATMMVSSRFRGL